MKKFLTQGRLAALIVAAVLVIDQVIKIAVKTNMFLHEHIRITDWFYIYFTENNGMAFGLEIFAKIFLTLFRIVAVILITWYLARIVRQSEKVKNGYIVCLSLILAGAVGNIIDCVFYGEVFSASTHTQIASWVPVGQGYADWLHGKVVDMFYFPIIDTYWPDWMPFVGGEHFIFFSPIFNFADASISCGIIALLLFYSRYLNDMTKSSPEKKQVK
ncbi:lipoprotein signal peptidase [Bacteroides gallinaceum]|uniref:Lipoprotein signal peptidase n=2 Tax=Bacteroidaceae TaxID=815 RepID=A0ABT7VFR1_9BACE|nr:lipoprotein signal peptidase [Bacteroides gallinaceum]MBU3856249.1 lipoprotein signal peptidase [Candidatus Phocaeicola excrementipullorum]MDM8325133.1 lipoprotein signal peptidase [Bacteroides gallinaceum]